MLHNMAKEKNKNKTQGVCVCICALTHKQHILFFKSRADAKAFGASCSQL